MNVISQDAFAKIAVNKSLCKEYSSSQYSRVVYLNNGDEYQIQLFNSEKHIIAAKIYIDGEELNDMLVLRPGERIWLERYLDKPRKFKFSTYEIDDSPEAKDAASLNGVVKVEFYRVKNPRNNPIVYINNVKDYYKPCDWNHVDVTYNDNTVYSSSISTISDGNVNTTYSVASNSSTPVDITLSCCTQDCCDFAASTAATAYYSATAERSIETGRTEQGRYSNQKFSYVNYDFESWPFKSETIQILPLSRKPVTSGELKKRYCTNCGRKISPKHKYCPYCGTKQD